MQPRLRATGRMLLGPAATLFIPPCGAVGRDAAIATAKPGSGDLAWASHFADGLLAGIRVAPFASFEKAVQSRLAACMAWPVWAASYLSGTPLPCLLKPATAPPGTP